MHFIPGLILLLFCLTSLARADDNAQSDEQLLKSLTETELSTTPKDVVTETASRYSQSRSNAGSSLRVVTSDDIRNYGYRSLGEVMRSLPGVYLNFDRGYNSLGIRGFNRPGDYNSRVLMLIDGERINFNVYESSPFDQNNFVDVDLIERVEFSPGPGSALYGPGAFLGVINIITKRGHQIDGVQFSGEYGGFDTYKARGSYGKRLDNGDEILLSATGFDREGHNSLYYPEFDTAEQNFGRSIKQDDERAQSAFAKWSHGPFTLQGAYNNRDKGLPAAPFGAIFNDPANKLTDQSAYASLNYDDSLGDNWALHAGLSFHRFEYTGHYAYSLPERNVYVDHSAGEWWRGELRAVNTSFDDHRLMFGGEIQHNYLQNQNNAFIDGTSSNNYPFNSIRYGFFVQDEFALTNNLTFLAGARYDYNPLGGESANPRLGLIWQALDNTTVKLLYGTAFRAPNALETQFSLGSSYKANPDLQAETIETTELALEHFFSPSTRFTTSLYHYELSNRITQVQEGVDGPLVYENRGSAQGLGADFSLEQRFENGIKGMFSYSLQRTEDQLNQRLFNSPSHLLKLHVSTPLWIDNWRLSMETLYTSQRTAKVGQVDDYILGNLTFTGDIYKNSQLSFSLYNLFNSGYADPVGGDFVQNSIPQDGRSFRLKLTIGF